MPLFHRYLLNPIQEDLQKKMVFLGGPRQVGKTTLSKQLLGQNTEGYLNWDIPEHRERILKHQWPVTDFWVLDEIHKYRQWRNTLKGIYDQYHQHVRVLVTGSAHLGFYRYSGDSLQGRYHYLRLHPLSVAELQIQQQADFMQLLTLGGFPEPFFGGNHIDAQRWSREYRMRLLDDDVRSLERVRDLGQLELLMLRLPELVGSPLSLNGLREDLQVSHATVSHWVEILERLYALFRVSPFGSPLVRAVKKEQKHYQMDWTLVHDDSYRFENMVACHLLKWVHSRQDLYGEEVDLRFFRDVDGREIDFILLKQNEPIKAIECKWNDRPADPALRYFKQRFPACEVMQISATGNKHYRTDDGIIVMPTLQFLQQLI